MNHIKDATVPRKTLEATAAQFRDGDVLVFRATDYLTDAQIDRFTANLQEFVNILGLRVYGIVLDAGITLETIPADRMRQLGWVRLEEVLVDLEADG